MQRTLESPDELGKVAHDAYHLAGSWTRPHFAALSPHTQRLWVQGAMTVASSEKGDAGQTLYAGYCEATGLSIFPAWKDLSSGSRQQWTAAGDEVRKADSRAA